MHRLSHVIFPSLLLVFASCSARVAPVRDTGLIGLALTKVAPSTLLAGSHVVLTGRSFVDVDLGAAQLILTGTLDEQPFDMRQAAMFTSSSELGLDVDTDFLAKLGGAPSKPRTFNGSAVIEYLSTVDNQRHQSDPLTLTLDFEATLEPTIDAVGDGVVFVNQPIEVDGAAFLLATGEGKTQAVLSGCFTPSGGTTCGANRTITVDATPAAANDRTRTIFNYATSISGIAAGNFAGTLQLQNVHADGTLTTSAPHTISFDVQPPELTTTSTTTASLGQYVVFSGGGFVGGGTTDESTTLALKGRFVPDGNSAALDLDLVLVPEFRSGLEIRYVLDENDALGQLINLRTTTGTIDGTLQAIVEQGGAQVTSDAVPVTLSIGAIKQVIYLHFLDEYVASLRSFGLRAAESLIRDRVVAVANRDYAGINVEFRIAPPDDFALYSQVDISGADPSGDHSFGFDNTPGKDTDNLRLYDLIGGVNAETQADGASGYGGVFLDSFFLFSTHPPSTLYDAVRRSDLWKSSRDPIFDQLFDPFRADRGGTELTATELATLDVAVVTLANGDACPAAKGDRAMAVSCAVFTLGSMIGSTMTHEVGHSLGLADPYGPLFHDPGDQINRLMDGGGYRPFLERVEIMGQGPARFCDTEFSYLRKTLPSLTPPPDGDRPTCD